MNDRYHIELIDKQSALGEDSTPQKSVQMELLYKKSVLGKRGLTATTKKNRVHLGKYEYLSDMVNRSKGS